MWARILPVVLCACAVTAEATDPGSDLGDDAESARTRAAWVAAQIAAWNAGLSADLRAEKYAQLAQSPSIFFRGTNHLFWADQAHRADLAIYGVDTWIEGDLHTDNVGSTLDDTGTAVFGMNDFDEAIVGDYQLDLRRLATSLVLEGRAAGVSDKDIHTALDAMSEAYLDQLDDDRKNDDENDRRFTAGATTGAIHDLLVSAAGNTNADLLGKWTVLDTDGRRVLDPANEDLEPVDIAPVAAALGAGYAATLHKPIAAAQLAVKSVARRLHAGLGSLGVERYYVLVEGPTAADGDDVILDVKAEPGATGAAYVAAPDADSEGERAATAERALDVHVDDWLGWLSLGGRSFAVRAISPGKGSLAGKAFSGASKLKDTATQLGRIVATFHARGDEDFDPAWVPFDFEAAVHELTDGDHAGFRALLWARASSQADQVAKDWAAWKP